MIWARLLISSHCPQFWGARLLPAVSGSRIWTRCLGRRFAQINRSWLRPLQSTGHRDCKKQSKHLWGRSKPSFCACYPSKAPVLVPQPIARWMCGKDPTVLHVFYSYRHLHSVSQTHMCPCKYTNKPPRLEADAESQKRQRQRLGTSPRLPRWQWWGRRLCWCSGLNIVSDSSSRFGFTLVCAPWTCRGQNVHSFGVQKFFRGLSFVQCSCHDFVVQGPCKATVGSDDLCLYSAYIDLYTGCMCYPTHHHLMYPRSRVFVSLS